LKSLAGSAGVAEEFAKPQTMPRHHGGELELTPGLGEDLKSTCTKLILQRGKLLSLGFSPQILRLPLISLPQFPLQL